MYQIEQLIVSKFKHTKNILKNIDIGYSWHKHHKFSFEIAHNYVASLGALVFKGQIFLAQNKLYLNPYIKPTLNFQYLHVLVHSVAFKVFIKLEYIRLAINTNESHALEEILRNFKTLLKRGYSVSKIDT